MEGRTFTLNCNGVVGDMLYVKQGYSGKETWGLYVAEVETHGSGKLLISFSQKFRAVESSIILSTVLAKSYNK
jgi:hypothetical protein